MLFRSIRKTKLVYILGTDGSGKTTHSKKFVEEFSTKFEIKYLYLQYFPFILKPIKYLMKLTVYRNKDEFKNYSSYANEKKKISSKFRFLTKIYRLIWYFDYLIQIAPKIYYQYLFKRPQIIILDRYYLDTITHISYLLNFNENEIQRDARLLEFFLPKANTHIFLEVSEEIAFKRKNDIQSVQYLTERKKVYYKLNKIYNFLFVDANKDRDEVYQSFKTILLNDI